MDWRPYIEPTTRHIPLRHHNSHAPSVHRSWPIAEIVRMRSLSLHDSDFEYFKSLEIQRFRQFNLSPQVVEMCAAWVPPIHSTIASKFSIARSRPRVFRVVLPYHVHIGVDIQSVCREVETAWNQLLSNIMPCEFSVRCSFRNSGVPLHIALRRGKL